MTAEPEHAERPLRVLMMHNRYLQRGGEDAVFEAERDLLRAHGHEVIEHVVSNEAIAQMSRREVARATIYHRSVRREIGELIARERPDVAHAHNTFPLLSAAAFDACHDHDVPVVHTLHNYRLLCANALLLRDGRACTDCVGHRVPLAGIRHACYRDSRAQSAAVTAMNARNRFHRVYARPGTMCVALTNFGRDLFVTGGVAPERIVVKPNFLAHDPGASPTPPSASAHALFVGRLAPEKGVDVLLDCYRHHTGELPPLTIIGDGPLADRVQDLAAEPGSHVRHLGNAPHDVVMRELADARMLVMPSTFYEGFGLTAIEAFAVGRPVIASGHGAIGEVVEDGVTGWHVRPGDADDLRATIVAAHASPRTLDERGATARDRFVDRYSAGPAYRNLIDLYSRARSESMR